MGGDRGKRRRSGYRDVDAAHGPALAGRACGGGVLTKAVQGVLLGESWGVICRPQGGLPHKPVSAFEEATVLLASTHSCLCGSPPCGRLDYNLAKSLRPCHQTRQ